MAHSIESVLENFLLEKGFSLTEKCSPDSVSLKYPNFMFHDDIKYCRFVEKLPVDNCLIYSFHHNDKKNENYEQLSLLPYNVSFLAYDGWNVIDHSSPNNSKGVRDLYNKLLVFGGPRDDIIDVDEIRSVCDLFLAYATDKLISLR